MVLPLTADERVANGTALLDWRSPGWRESVDVSTLDIADFCSCILGQTFGGYLAGMNALFGTLAWTDSDAINNGFEGDLDGESRDADYGALQEAWLRVL